MKLLLDQGSPRSTVTHLAVAGIFAEYVGHLEMAAATDVAILAVQVISALVQTSQHL